MRGLRLQRCERSSVLAVFKLSNRTQPKVALNSFIFADCTFFSSFPETTYVSLGYITTRTPIILYNFIRDSFHVLFWTVLLIVPQTSHLYQLIIYVIIVIMIRDMILQIIRTVDFALKYNFSTTIFILRRWLPLNAIIFRFLADIFNPCYCNALLNAKTVFYNVSSVVWMINVSSNGRL